MLACKWNMKICMKQAKKKQKKTKAKTKQRQKEKKIKKLYRNEKQSRNQMWKVQPITRETFQCSYCSQYMRTL